MPTENTENQQLGGLKLHQVELDLYQSHLGETDQKLESPYQILAYLSDKLGYKRVQSETSVLVKYRPRGSDLLVRYFDGVRGQVVGVDEYGRPWVQFDPKVWARAISASKVVSTGQSPFESGEPENIQPRMKSIRLDPLDVYSYRNQVAQLGWSSVKSAVVSTKSWEHLLPPAGKSDEDEDDLLYLNDDYEREAYFYDPQSIRVSVHCNCAREHIVVGGKVYCRAK